MTRTRPPPAPTLNLFNYQTQIKRKETKHLIKTKFNITTIVYTLVFMNGSDLVQEERIEQLLHRRTETNVKNHILKVVEQEKAVGYDLKLSTVEQKSAKIPFDAIKDYII